MLGSEDVTSGQSQSDDTNAINVSSKPSVATVLSKQAGALHGRREPSVGSTPSDRQSRSIDKRTTESPIALPATQCSPPPPLSATTAIAPAPVRHDLPGPQSAQADKSDTETEESKTPRDQLTGASAGPAQAAMSSDPLAGRSGDSNDQNDNEPVAAAVTAQPKAKVTRTHSPSERLSETNAPASSVSALAWQEPADGSSASALTPLQTDTARGTTTTSPREGGGQAADPSSTAPTRAEYDGERSLPQIQQLGQALATLHSGADGSSHTVIRLDPEELGSLQIRITRAHDGAASVSVAVDKPETLRTLQSNLSSLHHALDRAGLPDQRSVTLHLSPSGAETGNSQSPPQGGHGGEPQHGGARQ